MGSGTGTGYQPAGYPPGASGLYPPPGAFRDMGHSPQQAAAGSIPVTEPDSSPRSLGELISEITADLSTLVRQEVALAKAEATQSAKRAGKGAGMFGGAGFAGYFVLLFGSIALWWAIGDGVGHGWSALIVAVLWAVAGTILAVVGKKEFAQIRGLDRTTETLGKIPNAVKGHEEDNR
jgi:hypothetical protein